MSPGAFSFDDIVAMAARARDLRREVPLCRDECRRTVAGLARGYERVLRDEANRLLSLREGPPLPLRLVIARMSEDQS